MQVEGSAMIAAALVVLSVVCLMSIVGAWSGGCAEELLSFSACLPYVSSPPNNLTDTDMASPNCCNALHFQSLLCLCYLLRDPNLLGFPLNTTSLLSLSSICNSLPQSQQHPPLPSLNLLCSASPSLPPLTQPAAPAPEGGSSGRMVPGGSTGMGESHFPILNGAAAAPSTHFWNTLILSQILILLLFLLE